MRKFLGKKQSEFNLCEAVTNIFHGASLESESFRHHPQIITQLFVTLFDAISDFAAFKIGDQRVGNPPPGHPLPFLQLKYFAAQNVRLSHAAGPGLEKQIIADSQPTPRPREPAMQTSHVLGCSGWDCLCGRLAGVGSGLQWRWL